MKKSLLTLMLLAILSVGFTSSNTKYYKEPIRNQCVPSQVTAAFNQATGMIQEPVKWYPYPYSHERVKAINNQYFSAVNFIDEPEFYEVEYKEGGSSFRKVYGSNGKCRLEVAILNKQKISTELDSLLNALDYEMWGVRAYEHIKDLKTNEEFYKLLVVSATKTNALYLDSGFNVRKVRKWTTTSFHHRKGEVSLKTAYQGLRKKIKNGGIPQKVHLTISKDLNIGKQVLGYWELEPVHLPEHRVELEYYDLTLSSVYEVIYKKGFKKFKNSYSSEGVLLETVEIIDWENLPKFALDAIEQKDYAFWLFEGGIEKVKLTDGKVYYRLHAKEFGKPHLLVLNKE